MLVRLERSAGIRLGFRLAKICFSKDARERVGKDIKRCYDLLEINDDSCLQDVKDAFVRLARKYHPDSGTDAADSAKFDEIKKAYHTLRAHLTDDTPDDVNQTIERDFGIKHTVPQHRQYLSFEGVGHGTPSERMKQYNCHRVTQAAERVYQYRNQKINQQQEKSVVQKDASLARQYKTTQAIERLVEDLIQESIAKGEFNNLSGFGKPLKYAPENPFIDSTTQKLNQVLINNGFVPEWVMLQRELTEEKQRVRQTLATERAKLGPEPLDYEERRQWNTVLERLRGPVSVINRKIDKYNMVVPLSSKQQIHFQLQKESEKMLKSSVAKEETRSPKTKAPEQRGTTGENEGLLSIFFKLLKP